MTELVHREIWTKAPRRMSRAHLDTATGAPASGPAPLRETEPEMPDRRPALRHSMSPLVAVSRCARMRAPRKQRVDGNSIKEPAGGLGLTISARIIDRHGGRLDFGTQSGQQTVFRIMLPAYEEE
jgi:hypothetical protein